ncbi:hypothetical protein LN042_30295 [Kitasatospora sp. RB6PN24]|uniref:hypothetical protein n=1 Tax=Kitasatospora humi TaxID=2893891 RepID=UPI001E541305|nr:hypothetical protein [Kitasatospora humi]MCC9311302.1 hypothetical protein [Kitasatospora humi]
MGVLTDYFRAADAASVVQALERTDDPPLVSGGDSLFDGVMAKRLDPDIVLGELIAAIRQHPWEAGLVDQSPVWPTTPAPGPGGPQDEDDPWATGPWVVELGAAARDTLAGVRDSDVPAITARWVQSEALRPAGVEEMRPLVDELVRLARRAREAGERLYCWICL